MWNLIKREFNILQPNTKKNILLMIIVPLILFRYITWLEIEESYIILNLLFTFFISIYTMGHENPKSHYLINSLPIHKSQLVAGKYMFIHLCLLFSLIYLAVYSMVLKLFGIITLENLNFQYLQTAMLLMIMIINFLIALMNKPGLFFRMIYFLLFNVALRFLTDFEVIELLSEYKMLITSLALLSIGISLLISIFLYKKREFARG